MNESFNYQKLLLVLIVFVVSLPVSGYAEAKTSTSVNKAEKNVLFQPLKKQLIDDGFSEAYIEALFNDDKVEFDSEGVGLFFIHNEGSLNYETFANKTSIWRAKRYLKKHRKQFSKVEKKFGVDKTIITAIILVETGLGTYVGNRRVLNTLATMAAIFDSDTRHYLWDSIDNERRLPRSAFEIKANEKSCWAYEELKAFMHYVNRESLDPYQVYGSYAGALGIAQFMPTNILSFARDGNGDGKINLLNHSDAISSIASYLKHYGWHNEIEKERAHEVLYAYNHSSYYVDILMRISDLLKG